MALLYLDFETFSAADLRRVGAAAYAEHPTTGVWCAALLLEGEVDREAVWTPDRPLPTWARRHIEAGGLIVAHHAAFESAMLRYCPALAHWPAVEAGQWVDTMLMAALANLPRGMEDLAKVLGCAAQKDMAGSKLMKRLAKVPAGADMPEATPEELDRLYSYCRQDVRVTREVLHRLPRVPADERRAMVLDRRINERGVAVDLPLAGAAAMMAADRRRAIDAEVWELTGDLVSTSNTHVLLRWLASHGVEVPKVRRKMVDGKYKMTPSIDRASMRKLLERPDLPEVVAKVLRLRTEAGRAASLAKTAKLAPMANADGRLRNCFLFAGASTGRWSSKGVQLHNLTRPPKDFKAIRDAFAEAVLRRDLFTAAGMLPVLEGLSYLLRSMFVAGKDRVLLGFDFASVEARGAAWLAGDSRKLAIFRDYDAAATPEEKTERDPYVLAARAIAAAAEGIEPDRQMGKIAELALQYGMGDKKFVDFARSAGVAMPYALGRKIRRAWRDTNELIVYLHRELGTAFSELIDETDGERTVGRLTLRRLRSRIELVLPSGRSLFYWRPSRKVANRLIDRVDDDGNVYEEIVEIEELRYYTAGRGMELTSTYGGKLLENATQALCRDLLRDAMLRLDDAGYNLVLHVHDSVSAETLLADSEKRFARIASIVPEWADGFPVAVDTYRARYFKG